MSKNVFWIVIIVVAAVGGAVFGVRCSMDCRPSWCWSWAGCFCSG